MPPTVNVSPFNGANAADILKFMVNAADYKLDTNRNFANTTLMPTQNIQNNNGNTATYNIKVDNLNVDTPLDKPTVNDLAYAMVKGVQSQWDVTKNMRH